MTTSSFDHRVILHVDLDAFYAQVEQVRLGIPIDRPLAIQQWNGLIAVNYAARPYGIKRSMPVSEALEKCPELHLVHVATYANGETEPQYHRNPTVATHKVSLEPYRRASLRIMNIFRQYPNVVVQKASVDEAFLDVTCAIRERVEKAFNCDVVPKLNWEGLGVVVGLQKEEEEEVEGWEEVYLAEGAKMATEIRKEVVDRLGYTCSAGIALDSKVLAKVCSGMNKPNNQTVLRPSQVLNFLKDQPFQKLWNMGGKFGSRVESELNIETCGDVWQFPLSELQRRFGQSEGTFLYEIVRGLDREEITVRGMAKSMMAAKSLRPPVRNVQEAEHWLGILASELFTRVRDDYDDNQRWPKTLTLHYHPASSKKDRSKSCAFPRRVEVTCPDVITTRAVRLFIGSNRSSGGPADVPFPCIRFALAVGGLEKEESGMTEIHTFFTKGSNVSEEKPQAEVMTPVQNPVPRVSRSSVASFFSHPSGDKHVGTGVPKKNSNSTREEQTSNSPVLIPEFNEKKQKLPPPEKGIAKFFEKNREVQAEDESLLLFCDRCSVSVSPCKWDEHTDYHFAMDLLKSEREKEGQKGRKVEEKDWKGKRRRKEDFFAPFRT